MLPHPVHRGKAAAMSPAKRSRPPSHRAALSPEADPPISGHSSRADSKSGDRSFHRPPGASPLRIRPITASSVMFRESGRGELGVGSRPARAGASASPCRSDPREREVSQAPRLTAASARSISSSNVRISGSRSDRRNDSNERNLARCGCPSSVQRDSRRPTTRTDRGRHSSAITPVSKPSASFT
jgi:hypothetical protein